MAMSTHAHTKAGLKSIVCFGKYNLDNYGVEGTVQEETFFIRQSPKK